MSLDWEGVQRPTEFGCKDSWRGSRARECWGQGSRGEHWQNKGQGCQVYSGLLEGPLVTLALVCI